MGYLYIMEVPKLHRCKIGITREDPQQRQVIVQTGCPEKIERRWQSRNIPDYEEIEKMMHTQFMAFRTSGEWYDVPFEKLVIAADKLCRCGSDQKRIELLEKENSSLRNSIQRLKKRIEEQERRIQKMHENCIDTARY